MRSATDDKGEDKRVVTAEIVNYLCTVHVLLYLTFIIMHSQRLSEKPVSSWIITEPNGNILCAHCDCMAGLGECCSHVAFLLSAIEAGVRIRDLIIVTQKKACWVMPNGVMDVLYAVVKHLSERRKVLLPFRHSS